MNRISPVLDRLIGIEDPDDLMVQILEVLSSTGSSIPINLSLIVFIRLI
jgi:hypothetical protein